MVSDLTDKDINHIDRVVLILVVMEDGLWFIPAEKQVDAELKS